MIGTRCFKFPTQALLKIMKGCLEIDWSHAISIFHDPPSYTSPINEHQFQFNLDKIYLVL